MPDNTKTKIAIIGVGNVGSNLGMNLAHHGYPVKFGIRPGKMIDDLLGKAGENASSAPVRDAIAWADVVFLAVPADAARELAREPGLNGKVLVDCTNSLTWQPDGPVYAPPPEGSMAMALARAVPGARVVKGFNTFGYGVHLDPNFGGTPADVFLASDDAAAKSIVADISTRCGFQPVDAGPLRNAALLESLTVLWLHLAMPGGQGFNFTFNLLRR
jgi:8-hydroxy-5-deazaflavin:NADPH oxidoreductase